MPKFVFSLCHYFYYDDRPGQIIYYALLTLFSHTAQGLAAEELLCDVHNEKIEEFGVIDYYVILNLDLAYVLKRAYLNAQDHLSEWRDFLFQKRIPG